ncbi:metal-dependent hydrolase [Paenibacillus sp. S-38]|uniref:metal-dependent hydrolase n=1 Tax=Paenibacillus sp. S-38 TaxID=3416710 RepID=UPI003CF4B02F
MTGLHAFLHWIAGAALVYWMCSRPHASLTDRFKLVVLGGIAGLSPDGTKFFGDILGHSVLAVPVFGLLPALVCSAFIQGASFKKSWLVFSLGVSSHLFIDWIGNGAALLYPIIEQEYEFSLVDGSGEIIVLVLLLIALIPAVLRPSSRRLLPAGILAAALYLGFLSYSKIQLEHALFRQYQREEMNLLLTYPNNRQWEFMVRTKDASITGHSPYWGTDLTVDSQYYFRP